MGKIYKIMTVCIVVFFMNSCRNELDNIEVNTETVFVEVGDEVVLPTCNVVDSDKNCIVDVDELDLDTIGEYMVSFYTLDGDSIHSNIELLNVIVEDHTAPVLDRVPESITVGLLEVVDFSQLGLTAIDNYDGDITDEIIVNNQQFGNLAGSYTVEISITDSSGNLAKQDIELIVLDVLYAEITLQYIGETTIEVGSDDLSLPECSLFDDTTEFDCEIDTDRLDVDAVGVYEVYYTAEDETGIMFSIKHIVNVIDTVSPILMGDKIFSVSEVTLEFNEEIAWYKYNDALIEEFDLTSTLVLNLEEGVNTITVSDVYGNISEIEDIIVDTRDPQIIVSAEFGPIKIEDLEVDLEENEKLVWAIDVDTPKYVYLTRHEDGTGMLHVRRLDDASYKIDIQTSNIPAGSITRVIKNGEYIIISHASYSTDNFIEIFNLSDEMYHAMYGMDDTYYGRYIESEGDYLVTSDSRCTGYIYKLDDAYFIRQIKLETGDCYLIKTEVAISDGVGYFANTSTKVTRVVLDTLEIDTVGVSSFNDSLSLDVHGDYIVISNYQKWDSNGEVYLCNLSLSNCDDFHNEFGSTSNYFGFKLELNDRWMVVNEAYGDSTITQDTGLLHIYDLADLTQHYIIEDPESFLESRFGMVFSLSGDNIIVISDESNEEGIYTTLSLYEMRNSYKIDIEEENVESIVLTKDGELLEFESIVHEPGTYTVTVTDIFGRVQQIEFTIDLPF